MFVDVSFGHWSRGSRPSGAKTQLPGVAPLQVRQVPVQSAEVTVEPIIFNALAAGKDMPLTSLDVAAKTHEVIFAADKSAATGRPVKISWWK